MTGSSEDLDTLAVLRRLEVAVTDPDDPRCRAKLAWINSADSAERAAIAATVLADHLLRDDADRYGTGTAAALQQIRAAALERAIPALGEAARRLAQAVTVEPADQRPEGGRFDADPDDRAFLTALILLRARLRRRQEAWEVYSVAHADGLPAVSVAHWKAAPSCAGCNDTGRAKRLTGTPEGLPCLCRLGLRFARDWVSDRYDEHPDEH